MREIVIVPIFWGTAWRPGNGPIDWTGVDADIRNVAATYYFTGLNGHGLESQGTVAPAVLIDDVGQNAIPIPNNFKADQIWSFLDGLIDGANAKVPAPTKWNANVFRVYYGIAIAPNHFNVNPNTFGENNKTYRGVSAGYATANSDRRGAVMTFMHEVVEGAANDEIVDPCQAQTFPINGVDVERYHVDGRCWPHVDITSLNSNPSPSTTEGPYPKAAVPIDRGLCGTEELSYTVVETPFTVTAIPSAPGFTAGFIWSINGTQVPPGAAPLILSVPVDSIDPRPPRTFQPHPIQATLNVLEADAELRFVTDPQDGNFDLDITVDLLTEDIATTDATISMIGLACPELDAADKNCRDRFRRAGEKLDQNWNHWVNPGDPILTAIEKQPATERGRLLTLVSFARQLKAHGEAVAEEFTARVASALGVEPDVVIGKTDAPPTVSKAP